MSFCIILAVNSSGLRCRCILVLPTSVFYFILGSLLSIQVDFMDRKVFVVFFWDLVEAHQVTIPINQVDIQALVLPFGFASSFLLETICILSSTIISNNLQAKGGVIHTILLTTLPNSRDLQLLYIATWNIFYCYLHVEHFGREVARCGFWTRSDNMWCNSLIQQWRIGFYLQLQNSSDTRNDTITGCHDSGTTIILKLGLTTFQVYCYVIYHLIFVKAGYRCNLFSKTMKDGSHF